MKLKSLLKESKVWDRKFGEPLPTLEDTTKRFKIKQENLNENDISKLGKLINKPTKDIKQFVKDYEVEADDLIDVIEAGGRRYHLMVVAAIGGNQRALRKLDDLLGFL
jgi:hypothetical protein